MLRRSASSKSDAVRRLFMRWKLRLSMAFKVVRSKSLFSAVCVQILQAALDFSLTLAASMS
jgi:hypothetical protein